MNKGDRIRLCNPQRMAEVNLQNRDLDGSMATLVEPLSSYEVTTRPMLKGEDAWWAKLDYYGTNAKYYIPISCIQSTTVMRPLGGWTTNDRAKLINLPLLEKAWVGQSEGATVTLLRPLNYDELTDSKMREIGGKAWWCRLERENTQVWIPEGCLAPVTSEKKTESATTSTQTITIKQKETENMYVYVVRMMKVPNTLAQQAGEKEQIVLEATETLAENEYSAIAQVAADHADVVKAVEESKGALRVTCKNAG